LDPAKVTEGLAGVSAGLIAVIATLQSALARCITLGASISDLYLAQYHDPAVATAARLLAPEFHKWIEPGFSYGIKIIGFWVAFFIQRSIQVYLVSLRGVNLLVSGLHQRQLIDDEQKKILMKISNVIAALGFLKQLFWGAKLYLVFSFFLSPIYLLEYLLSWLAVL